MNINLKLRHQWLRIAKVMYTMVIYKIKFVMAKINFFIINANK